MEDYDMSRPMSRFEVNKCSIMITMKKFLHQVPTLAIWRMKEEGRRWVLADTWWEKHSKPNQLRGCMPRRIIHCSLPSPCTPTIEVLDYIDDIYFPLSSPSQSCEPVHGVHARSHVCSTNIVPVGSLWFPLSCQAQFCYQLRYSFRCETDNFSPSFSSACHSFLQCTWPACTRSVV